DPDVAHGAALLQESLKKPFDEVPVFPPDRTRASPALATLTHAALAASAPAPFVGERIALTLTLHDAQGAASVPLSIPPSALELTLFVEAPGFVLDGEHVRTVAVVAGRPTEAAVAFGLRAAFSGEHKVMLLVQPGASAESSATKLSLDLSVRRPTHDGLRRI